MFVNVINNIELKKDNVDIHIGPTLFISDFMARSK